LLFYIDELCIIENERIIIPDKWKEEAIVAEVVIVVGIMQGRKVLRPYPIIKRRKNVTGC
jgi:hypothetical protein